MGVAIVFHEKVSQTNWSDNCGDQYLATSKFGYRSLGRKVFEGKEGLCDENLDEFKGQD